MIVEPHFVLVPLVSKSVLWVLGMLVLWGSGLRHIWNAETSAGGPLCQALRIFWGRLSDLSATPGKI